MKLEKSLFILIFTVESAVNEGNTRIITLMTLVILPTSTQKKLEIFQYESFYYLLFVRFLPVKCGNMQRNKVRAVASGRSSTSSCCRSRRSWPPAGTTAGRWRTSSGSAAPNWPRRWRRSSVSTARSWEPSRLGSHFPQCLGTAAKRKQCSN